MKIFPFKDLWAATKPKRWHALETLEIGGFLIVQNFEKGFRTAKSYVSERSKINGMRYVIEKSATWIRIVRKA